MTPKKITNEELARIIQRDEELDTFRTEVNERLDGIDRSLGGIDRRLHDIKEVVLADHQKRIQALEQAVLGFKPR